MQQFNPHESSMRHLINHCSEMAKFYRNLPGGCYKQKVEAYESILGLAQDFHNYDKRFVAITNSMGGAA